MLREAQLRIGIYYDTFPETGFRNDGNPRYTWASIARRQEAGQDYEIDVLAPKADMALFGKYDVNLWVDWGEDALKSIIPYPVIDCPKPNIYWCSDTHINNGTPDSSYPYRLETAKKFDKVFVAQKRAMEEFKRDGVDCEWLPHAVAPLVYPKLEYASKDFDICFVGNVNSPNRVDMLDRMFREFPNFYFGQRRFTEAAEKFCKSKICLNISMTDDINMRTFEIMGTGSFCLTNWIPTMEDVFEDGKHLVLYKSLDEAVDKAKYYLAHDAEREKIALAGYEEVMAKHTIDKRVDRILQAAHNLTLVEV